MKSASLNLIGIFELPRSCIGDSCGAANNAVPAIFKTLILGKGAELLKIHEMVQLSLHLIQLSSAQNLLPDAKKLSVGFKHL